jgi:hypothetical protein
MNFLVGIRRLDHIQYFSSVIDGVTKESTKLYIAIDPNFLLNDSVADTKAYLENEFGWAVEKVLMLSAGPESAHKIKKMLGCLIYLNDYNLEWSYLVRHAKRSRISRLNFLLLNFLRNLPDNLRVFLSTKLTKLYRNSLSDSNLVNEWMRDLDLDLIFLSPGNMFNSYEDNLILDGRNLNVRTIVQTLSWDNLNSKGTVMAVPDLYLCWNEMHSELLMKRHLIPRDRIRIPGSVFFEKYAGISKGFTKLDFCDALGISSEKEIIIYMGSSSNVCRNETIFLLNNLRNYPEFTEKYFLLIRPHPANIDVWRDWLYEGTTVWPKFQSLEARSVIETYSILNSSEGVIGINTSGFLDALACGVPVVALENPDAIFQENTMHYSRLIQDGVKSVKSIQSAVDLIEDSKYASDLLSTLELTLPMRNAATSNTLRFIEEIAGRPNGGDNNA